MQNDGTEKFMHLNPGVEVAPKTDETKLELGDKQHQIEESLDGVTLVFILLSQRIKWQCLRRYE